MSSGLILLATIGAPHGVKGEVRVKSFAADPTALVAYGPLTTDDGRSFEIGTLRASKGHMLIVKFRGVDDRNAAEALNGLSLYADRTALPAPDDDEFYHADLIGLAAFGPAGERLGTVVAVHDFGAGDILDIQTEGGPSMMVPFTRACVPDIDIAAGRLTIVPPAEVEAGPESASEEDET
ncbi:MAG: ribosome maturation factor RimM [Propylenella sp.]